MACVKFQRFLAEPRADRPGGKGVNVTITERAAGDRTNSPRDRSRIHSLLLRNLMPTPVGMLLLPRSLLPLGLVHDNDFASTATRRQEQ